MSISYSEVSERAKRASAIKLNSNFITLNSFGWLHFAGSGNGELVVNNKNDMLPPHPSIELLLANASNLIFDELNKITFIVDEQFNNGAKQQNNPLSNILNYSKYLDVLVTHFPNSGTISSSVNKLLNSSIDKLTATATATSTDHVTLLSCCSIALSCGGEFEFDTITDPNLSKDKIVEIFKSVRGLEFVSSASASSSSSEQNARSSFQLFKWETLAQLSQLIFSINDSNLVDYSFELVNFAAGELSATPTNAIKYLFETSMCAAEFYINNSTTDPSDETLKSLFSAMWATIEEEEKAWRKKVSERSAKWVQTATSTTKLTHSIYFAPSSLGAGYGHCLLPGRF